MNSLLIVVIILALASGCRIKEQVRSEISLNGMWELAITDTLSGIPPRFNSEIPVPGLIDMANPSVDSQDTVYENSVYWYRRGFKVDDLARDVIKLKINKARYHTRVYVNGSFAGENIYNFTPSVFDIKPFLNTSQEANILVIAVGCKNNLPDTVTNGWDFEKIKYIPGIYDDVKLIVADYPYISNIQVAPDITDRQVRVAVEVDPGDSKRVPVDFEIREAASGRRVTFGKYIEGARTDGQVTTVNMLISLDSCRLWSPEDPFLYELSLGTGGDTRTTKFGMRSFRASPDSGIFLLNGKPYYMRGTNVCIYRFFEDPDRGALPWDSKWVTKLHSKFRDMHWTTIRYCIGFPPERWYEIADSLGFLIQDEYPLWTLGKDNYNKYLGNLNPEQLAAEYREWMRERWNHPCVVIWDAQNESITDVTGKAIELVRKLDMSDRPWDNGWAPPVSRTDAIESHPYLFSRYQRQKPAKEGYLRELFSEVRIPGNDPNSHFPLPDGKRYENPIILNEYGWIWLNRDGSTTTLTDKVYENVWPWAKTPEQRLEIFAKTLGILTEYWRAYRKAAAVMHFCGLGYSRSEDPRGQTSDHFIDLKNLTYEPNFYKYVRPAFSPVGIMAEFWEKSVTGGGEYMIPVHIINDTNLGFCDTLKVSVFMGNKLIFNSATPVKADLLGKVIYRIPVAFPDVSGKCRLEAEIIYNGDQIRSIREFEIR